MYAYIQEDACMCTYVRIFVIVYLCLIFVMALDSCSNSVYVWWRVYAHIRIVWKYTNSTKTICMEIYQFNKNTKRWRGMWCNSAPLDHFSDALTWHVRTFFFPNEEKSEETNVSLIWFFLTALVSVLLDTPKKKVKKNNCRGMISCC